MSFHLLITVSGPRFLGPEHSAVLCYGSENSCPVFRSAAQQGMVCKLLMARSDDLGQCMGTLVIDDC